MTTSPPRRPRLGPHLLAGWGYQELTPSQAEILWSEVMRVLTARVGEDLSKRLTSGALDKLHEAAIEDDYSQMNSILSLEVPDTAAIVNKNLRSVADVLRAASRSEKTISPNESI
ncbi:hypothetical protein GCM10027451_03530 [Geodermatophilus aquaeductus]